MIFLKLRFIILALILFYLPLVSFAKPRSFVSRQGDYSVKQLVVPDFDKLPLDRKMYVYYLAQAVEAGRDIVWKQLSREGLAVRNFMEALYTYSNKFSPIERAALEDYLIQIEREHGLYNINKNTKIIPDRSLSFTTMLEMAKKIDAITSTEASPTRRTAFARELTRLRRTIFDPKYYPYFEVSTALRGQGLDPIADSGSNFYGDGITEAKMKALPTEEREHFLSRPELDENGDIRIRRHRIGENYSDELLLVDHYLSQAWAFANNQEKAIIDAERKVIRTGDPKDLRTAEVLWVQYKPRDVDFRVGFVETYADPLAIRGYWEGYLTLAKQDPVTKARHSVVRSNSDLFESLMPVDPEFKKPKGFTPPEAESVYFIMTGGETGEAPPSGINLPNAHDIREEYGSKSITAENMVTDIGGSEKSKRDPNVMFAYYAPENYELYKTVDQELASSIQVEFHEILGHGSGRSRKGVNRRSFGSIYSTLEEARAEVASLYHMTDFNRLREIGVFPSEYTRGQAYDLAKWEIVNFFTSQLRSYASKLADETAEITQAHQLGRQAMLNWLLSENAIEIVISPKGIPQIIVKNLEAVRLSLGRFWNDVQNMKSRGLTDEAITFFKHWGVYTDEHREWRKAILTEMDRQGAAKLSIYLNPTFKVVKDAEGKPIDVTLHYTSANGLRAVLNRQIEVSKRNQRRMRELLPKIKRESCDSLLI